MPYTAPFTITSTTTVKAIAYDGTNASTIATATYTYVDPNAPGTQNNPYTVDQARKAIDAGSETQGVYATGIVSAIPTAWSSDHNNITFNFVDNAGDTDFLQAYRCASGDGADASQVAIGDIVVVYGNLTKYGSTYEFGQGCKLISLIHPAVAVEKPTFSVASGIFDETQTVSISCATKDAAIYYTTDGTDPTNASTPYEVPLTISSNTILKAVAYVGTASSYVESATYCFPETKTVTEALAIINSMENGATSDWEYYVSGIVSTAGASLSSGTLTYSISADGQTTNELTVYRGKGLNNEAFEAATDIQVNDIVTVCGKLQKYFKNSVVTPEIASGNFLKSFDRPATPIETKVNVGSLTHVAAVRMWLGNNDLTDIESGDEVAAGTEVFVLPTAEDGFTVESVTVVDASNNPVNVTKNTGNWSFVMPNSSVTINVTAISSSVTPDDKTLTNANIVAAGEAADGYNTWCITDTNNKEWNAYAMKKAHSKATSDYHYLQIKKYASNTAYYLQVPEYGTKITKIEMTVSSSSNPMTEGGNTATLFFSAVNSTSAEGESVALGTGASTVTIDCSDLNLNTGYITASGAVRIWDVTVTYEEATSETVTVSVNALATDGNKFYSTLYYSDKNLKIPAGITASGVSVNGKSLVMGPVLAKDDVIAKGNAVLLTADAAGDYEFTVVADTEVDATISWDANLLRGNDEEATTEGGDVYYQLSRNANRDANSIGFYWGAANGEAFKNKAHRAYLAVTTEQAGGAKGFAFNDMATGIKSIAADTENGNAIIYNLAGQRVSNAQKGIYIVNGKKVVIR
ncbi:MAG: chitobiase/beta-hexosaminidase C-terminal domain-containing protein [Prevotella sp.]|nr:chitobiase/beta-hexosaminidase C-terminal domain-containing protein [Prevotella sp.]